MVNRDSGHIFPTVRLSCRCSQLLVMNDINKRLSDVTIIIFFIRENKTRELCITKMFVSAMTLDTGSLIIEELYHKAAGFRSY
jgi:hypothetical protein